MRFVIALTCLCFASPLTAAEYHLNATVTKAVIFGSGASVTRMSEVALPVGRHRLTITLREQVPTVTFEGSGNVKVLAMGQGQSKLLEVDKSTNLLALEAAFETARQEMRAYQVRIEAAASRQTAAEMRLDFLRTLVAGKGMVGKADAPLNAQALEGIVGLLGAQAIDALAEISKAETELSNLRQHEVEIKNNLIRAQDALEQATPPELRVQSLVLDVSVTEAFDGKLVTNGLADDNISWRPFYELDLQQTGDTGQLEIKRRAAVSFDSNESWKNVDLVLSTAPLSNSTSLWVPSSQLRGLRDPVVIALQKRKVSPSASYGAAPNEPEPVVELMEEPSGPVFQGQTLLFQLGGGNDLLWSDQDKLFELDKISAPVSLYGLAVASADTQAFLYTDFTNETGGVILPGDAKLYRDGTLVGIMQMPLLNSGAETAIGLGPLLGMQVEKHTLKAVEGESGFISSSSETSREMETTVTSSLDYPIWVKLLDVVPTSENEDLVITMRTIPRPNETNYNGQRGVLEWNLDMEAGIRRTVKFSYKMSWPKDKELTYR